MPWALVITLTAARRGLTLATANVRWELSGMKLLGVVGLILIMLVAGCGSPSPEVSGRGEAPRTVEKKRVVAAIRGEPITLSSTANSAAAGGVAGVGELEEMIHVGLTEVLDRRVVVRARLAEAYPTIDNGLWKVFPDGRMETTWRIRPDARWHDGTPFTAADLIFTTQLEQDSSLALLKNSTYDWVDRIVAPDPRTITVYWKRPYINADSMFAQFGMPLPKHLLEQPYQENKETFFDHPYWTKQFVGTGPFKLKQWVEHSHLVIEAYDGYIFGRPKLDEVEVRFLPDPNVMVANVLAGVVGITLGRGLSPEQGFQATAQWKEGRVDQAPGNWIALFPQFVNPQPAVLANVEMRRALLHAADRQQMVNSLLEGQSRVADSYVGPDQPEFADVQSSVTSYPYDLARANQLFERLGYTKGGDGIFRDASGQSPNIEIRTTGGDDLRDKIMFSIADSWNRAGIPTETVIVPRALADDREYRANRPAFEIVRQPNTLTESALRRFESREAALPENRYRGANRVRYQNPEYDVLMERYLVAIQPTERLELARQLVRHFSENLPVMGVLYSITPMLITNRLVNVTAEVNTRNSHEWDLR
jgi:peptide/nickel transport system substrate-binding protein